jgi:sugar phosphate isomerase/epimerase
MNTTRRSFIKNSAVLLAGTTLLSKSAFAIAKSSEIVGVQLYSVRDEMAKDPLGTLTQLAKMGYKYVEHANYVDRKFYGFAAVEFKKILDDLGLKMPSGHTVMAKNHWDESKKSFTDTWKQTIDDAAILEQKFVISPWMDESMRNDYDTSLRYMEVFNLNGELCKKAGMKFGYHNHDFEFSQKFNDKTVFDIMMENFDFNLVAMQLDIGNMFHADAKAMDIIGKYPGKFEMIHVKDEIIDQETEKFESTILGEGIVPVKKVIDLCRKIGGTNTYIIEQEAYQGKQPIDCVKLDLKIMKKWGYE